MSDAKLQDMFDRQKRLAKNFIPIDQIFNGEVSSLERQKYITTYWQLLIEEAVEFLRECPARKFWRPSIQNKEVNAEALREELADIWHIVIALSLIIGLDADGLYEEYVKKNEINLQRVANKS